MTQSNNTPTCTMHEALITYLYDEATADESRRFAAHLQDCPSCRQELASFEAVRESLQQWQLGDSPNMRLIVGTPRPSALTLLKELFTVLPLWAKGFAAAAAVLLLVAVLGLEIRLGGGQGFTLRAHLFRTTDNSPAGAGNPTPGVVALTEQQLEQLRAGLLKEVEVRIAQAERQQQEAWQAQRVSFEEQWKGMRAADLVKLAARVQEHAAKLKTIERDIDRREGLGLSDILFSDATTPAAANAGDKNGSE